MDSQEAGFEFGSGFGRFVPNNDGLTEYEVTIPLPYEGPRLMLELRQDEPKAGGYRFTSKANRAELDRSRRMLGCAGRS